MRQKITDSLRLCGFGKPIYNLITLNTSKRFVVVLFANGDALSDLSVSAYHAFYQQLSKQISPEMSIYIGNFISFSEMRSEIHRIDTFVANNVNKNLPCTSLSRKKILQHPWMLRIILHTGIAF